MAPVGDEGNLCCSYGSRSFSRCVDACRRYRGQGMSRKGGERLERLEGENKILRTGLRGLNSQLEKLHLKHNKTKSQLQDEIVLHRVAIKGELQAKRDLDHVVALCYSQEAQIRGLKARMRASSKWVAMIARTERQAAIRRLDSFADVASICHVILSNLNLKSQGEEDFVKVLISDGPRVGPACSGIANELLRLVRMRRSTELNVLENMQREWEYMVEREQLYDQLREAEMALWKIEELENQRLREILQGLRPLRDLEFREISDLHQSKIPVRDSLWDHIIALKDAIDNLEQSRLNAWQNFISSLVEDLPDDDIGILQTLQIRRADGLRTQRQTKSCSKNQKFRCSGSSRETPGSEDGQHREPADSGEEVCIYCNDGSCQGCSSVNFCRSHIFKSNIRSDSGGSGFVEGSDCSHLKFLGSRLERERYFKSLVQALGVEDITVATVCLPPKDNVENKQDPKSWSQVAAMGYLPKEGIPHGTTNSTRHLHQNSLNEPPSNSGDNSAAKDDLGGKGDSKTEVDSGTTNNVANEDDSATNEDWESDERELDEECHSLKSDMSPDPTIEKDIHFHETPEDKRYWRRYRDSCM